MEIINKIVQYMHWLLRVGDETCACNDCDDFSSQTISNILIDQNSRIHHFCANIAPTAPNDLRYSSGSIGFINCVHRQDCFHSLYAAVDGNNINTNYGYFRLSLSLPLSQWVCLCVSSPPHSVSCKLEALFLPNFHCSSIAHTRINISWDTSRRNE